MRVPSDASGYYPAPGEWEAIFPPGERHYPYWQSILPNSKTAEIVFHNKLVIVGSYCYFYEAERGQGTFSIDAQIIEMNAGRRRDQVPEGADWVSVYPETVCARSQGVRFQITSPTTQTFRISRYIHQSNKTPTRGYVAGLCPFGRRCPETIPSASTLPTKEGVLRDFSDRRSQNIIYAASSGGLALLIWLGPLAVLSNILAALLPSRDAKRVRREVRNSMEENRAYDFSTHDPYFKNRWSSFRRRQDIDDLEMMLAEAQSEIEKLLEEEERLAQGSEMDAKLAEALAAWEKRVYDLEEKIRDISKPTRKV